MELHSKSFARDYTTTGTLRRFEIPQLNFVSDLSMGSDDFAPEPLAGLEPFAGGFSDYLKRSIFDMTKAANLAELDAEFTEYKTLLTHVTSSFQPLLSRYDKEQVLSATCALGVTKPHHFDIDEQGSLGKKRDFVYPEDLVTVLVENLARLIPASDDDVRLSMTRGTNSGWFSPLSRRSREQSDLILALHCKLAVIASQKGLSLEELTSVLETQFGPRFAYCGFRMQHHSKPHLLCSADGEFVSHNFEPRVRAIYMSPKFMVAYNRFVIKPILKGVLASDFHVQDRAIIQKRISDMSRGSWVIALDCSKFDQNHGGPIGKQLVGIAARAFVAKRGGDVGRVESDLLTEFLCPGLVKSKRGTFIAKGGEILSSGVSMTTVVNCVASEGIVIYLASRMLNCSFSEANSRRGRDWDALTFGDDMIFSIAKNRFPSQTSFEEAIAKLGDEIQLVLTAEPTLKFLGENYNMLSYEDSPLGYPVGRFIQQQFFPERKKNYPFSQVGYIARLLLVDAKFRPEIHKFMKPFFPILRLEDFDLSRINDVLLDLLPKVEKFSQEISQMDDILAVLTHGLSPDDINFELDGPLLELLAQSKVDMTDPDKFISEHAPADLLSSPHYRSIDQRLRSLDPGAVSEFFSLFRLTSGMYNTYSRGRGPIF